MSAWRDILDIQEYLIVEILSYGQGENKTDEHAFSSPIILITDRRQNCTRLQENPLSFVLFKFVPWISVSAENTQTN